MASSLPASPRAKLRGGDGDTTSVVSTQLSLFSATSASKLSASAMSKLSTESKQVNAAVGHVHRVLFEQQSVLRKVFLEVDTGRDGIAPRQVLKDAIIAATRLHPRWHKGLDRILELSDAGNAGSIAFGRLMRLIRTPIAKPGSELGSSSTAGAATSPRYTKYELADDGDSELRATFAGVNTGDKALLRRLGTPREMPPMPTGVRATNILGDSKVRAPWAVAGDDARMNHILSSMHVERLADLRAVLVQHAGPAGAQKDRITHRQLNRALHEFDPFVHDAEVLQYFMSMVNDERGENSEQLQSADGVTRQTSGDDSVVPARLKRESVSISKFLDRFGNNVLASPAMRCSATFALKWTLPAPRPPAPPPVAYSPRSAAERRKQREEAAKLFNAAKGQSARAAKGSAAVLLPKPPARQAAPISTPHEGGGAVKAPRALHAA